MKRLVLCTGLAIASLVADVSPAQPLTEAQAKQPIARVGDEFITAGQFARELQVRAAQIKQQTGQIVKPDERFRRALMNDLIAALVLRITAENHQIPVSEEAVNADFEERKQVFDSEEAYKHYLDRLNLTEVSLKEQIRSRLQVAAFVEQEIGEITATDEEIVAAYDLMKAGGAMERKEMTRDVAVMLLRAKGGTDESWRAAEERAEAARARVVAGEDFQTVAAEVSEDPAIAAQGGVLREVKDDGFYPELHSVLEALKPGEISEPVRSVMGWYVLKVMTENAPGIIPLDSVRDKVEAEVLERKRREAVGELVEEAQLLLRVELFEATSDGTPIAPEQEVN